MFLNETPMDRLITDAYLYAIDADIALSHGWRYGAPILPGVITVEDLYQIIPTNPELFTLELEGRFILEAFETNLEQVFSPDPFQQKGGYVLRTSGVIMAYKSYNPTPKDGESNIFSFKINRLNRMPYTELSVPANKSSDNISPSKSIWEFMPMKRSGTFFRPIKPLKFMIQPAFSVFSSDVHKPRQPYSLDQSSSSCYLNTSSDGFIEYFR